ncbi:hypothetical protein PCANC_15827, partial [Puccinia coronata f. sp. avenae]
MVTWLQLRVPWSSTINSSPDLGGFRGEQTIKTKHQHRSHRLDQYSDTSNDIEAFKARVIQAIMEKEDESFAVYVEKQDANGNVQWFATVPNDHTFAANHKRRLESNEIFKSFVTASSRVADN